MFTMDVIQVESVSLCFPDNVAAFLLLITLIVIAVFD